jgi:hypothetical protein
LWTDRRYVAFHDEQRPQVANDARKVSPVTLYLVLWIEYVVLAAAMSFPAFYFGWKRTRWNTIDLLALALPFAVWLLLMQSGQVGKSLANYGECIWISAAVGVAAFVRVLVGERVPGESCSVALLATLCFFAACLYWWTPQLPE